jgi:23S rRNA (pseudouridine1915-N3)-methyltransferase
MHITIVAVGKLKPSPLFSLIQDYLTQLHWKVLIKELDSKEEHRPTFAEKFISLIPKSSMIIALDEKGLSLSSLEFSQSIEKWQTQGESHLCFLIGAANGLPALAKQKAQCTLSFGRATWPHMMVRLLLAEQLYRAQQILTGHPYHRE